MASITLQGKPVHTEGTLPQVGSQAPDFKFTKTDLTDASLKDYQGKKVVLNIFPSVDTGVCAASVRQFNEKAGKLTNSVVLCISVDTPFAHKRFCGAEGLSHVISGSVFRHLDFGKKYGVTMTDGSMAGLLSRAVVVLDEHGKVTYTQQVSEIASEPDYHAALDALQ